MSAKSIRPILLLVLGLFAAASAQQYEHIWVVQGLDGTNGNGGHMIVRRALTANPGLNEYIGICFSQRGNLIQYTNSTDGGATWPLTPEQVRSDLRPTNTFPALQVDASRNPWVCFYSSQCMPDNYRYQCSVKSPLQQDGWYNYGLGTAPYGSMYPMTCVLSETDVSATVPPLMYAAFSMYFYRYPDEWTELHFVASDTLGAYYNVIVAGSSLFPVGRSLIVPVPSVRLVNARYTVTSRCVGSCSAVASQVVQA